ncbi:MAG: DNA-3-methyladenine glycosylase 2 family protein [Actinomycetia bacterium]|nr:DNA-3-methyladenine glycosylase 2 family protein [Actinomycetes bacterium]
MDQLDHETCYQAISRRDARFDGRFYTAVTTTGIFCRPSCPARTPKSANVRFFPHAATASEAGFRPCRRCRPELAPGHPEWNRRADLTGRALKLIEGGTVDQVGVAGLASQLGVSERHLRRELQRTVGTGPLQLARARRLWLARLLLDQTSLTVTEVAFASGFSSIRQFNDSIRRAFDAPPSALRRRVGIEPTATSIVLELPCRGELGWDSLHQFFAMRAIPGLESSSPDGTFRRQVPGGWIELSAPRSGPTENRGEGDGLRLECSLDRLSDLAELLPLIRRVADLETDLVPIEHHLARDPVLAERLAAFPLSRLPGAFDPFEIAIRAVVGQQVSVAAARTLLGRLIKLTNDPDEPVQRFPTPDQVAAAPLDQLGMPNSRRATILAVATAMAKEQLDLGPHVDPDRTRADLEAIKGIGPWTAGYITMRALGDPDGWPRGDLVLRRSLDCSTAELEERARSWKPWRAYAALLLWRSNPTSQPTKNGTQS